jgi:hypothetical protein
MTRPRVAAVRAIVATDRELVRVEWSTIDDGWLCRTCHATDCGHVVAVQRLTSTTR